MRFLVMLLVLVGCKRAPTLDPKWAAAMPSVAGFEVRFANDDDVTLTFDPKVRGEEVVIEAVSADLLRAGWVELDRQGGRTRRFARVQGGKVFEVYTGYSELHLRERAIADFEKTQAASASQSPEQRRADLMAVAEAVERGSVALAKAAEVRCDAARMKGLVPAGFMAGRVAFFSSTTPKELLDPARDVIGGLEPERLRTPADEKTERWLWEATTAARKSGVLVIVEPKKVVLPRVVSSDTFTPGVFSARFVVVNRETGEALCAGSVFAGSSSDVTAVKSKHQRVETSVGADLGRNATEAFRRVLGQPLAGSAWNQ